MHTVLSTRLKVPTPRTNYIARKALFKRLDQLQDMRLAIIKGGAGMGKTTLLSSYSQMQQGTFRWISLAKECNHILVFWEYVLGALEDVLTVPKADFLQCMGLNSSTELEQILNMLINALRQDEEIFLVWDGFEVIEETGLLKSIEYWIQHMPSNIHLVILTRTMPSLYVTKLEMEGELLMIDEGELMLSQEEALAFLEKTMQIQASEHELACLIQKAHGWVGGLHLISALHNKQHNSAVPTQYSSDSILGKYMTREIYMQLNKEEQQFLVYTSILNYFDPLISQYFFRDLDFQKMIEILISKNVMLQCIDSEQHIYQYHNLLKEYLNNCFLQLSELEQKALHQKASEAFATRGDDEQALYHLFESKAYSQAMQYILALPQNTIYFVYMSKVPIDEAIQCFDFAMMKFFCHYKAYEVEACMKIYESALCMSTKDARYNAFLGIKKLLVNEETMDKKEAILSIDEVTSLEANELTKALILLKNGAYFMAEDRYEEALACVDVNMSYLRRERSIGISYYNLSLKMQICEEKGLFQQALATYEQIKALLRDNEVMRALYHTMLDITVLGIYLKQLSLDQAMQTLLRCKETAERQEGYIEYVYNYNKAEYLFLTDQVEEAIALLKQLMVDERLQDILIVSTLLRYLYKQGEMSAIIKERFKEAYLQQAVDVRKFNDHLLYAELIYEEGEVEQAIMLIDKVLVQARKQGSYLKIVEATLLKFAIKQGGVSDERIVENLLKEAIYYACEEQMYMPFWVQKESLQNITRQVGADFIKALSTSEQSFWEKIKGICHLKEQTVLSERELEIIKLIDAGMTNKEIAMQLYISVATVKTHILNTYRKLEVNSRVAATKKARQLGMI